LLDGDNMYRCDDCGRKVPANKGLQFSKMPYLLVVHLKRFVFSYETFTVTKAHDAFSFPEVLDLNQLQEESFGESGDSNFSLNNNLEENLQTALSHGENVYLLYGIVCHMGSSSGGHYYSFIKSFDDNNWYEFNDTAVSSVEWSHIPEQTMNSGYILFYRKYDTEKNQVNNVDLTEATYSSRI